MVVAIVSGLISSVSGTLVRMLSVFGGPHDGRAPPEMLFPYLMVVLFVLNGIVAIVLYENSSIVHTWQPHRDIPRLVPELLPLYN